jgi:hypothetical protein
MTSNATWIEFKPTWIQWKPIWIHFGLNSNQIALNIFIINQIMKIKFWHVNLLFYIHVSGLVKGMKELGLDFHMECFRIVKLTTILLNHKCFTFTSSDYLCHWNIWWFQKCFPQIMATLLHYFHRSPLYYAHFLLPSGENLPKKKRWLDH